jgi:hypothetical protein
MVVVLAAVMAGMASTAAVVPASPMSTASMATTLGGSQLGHRGVHGDRSHDEQRPEQFATLEHRALPSSEIGESNRMWIRTAARRAQPVSKHSSRLEDWSADCDMLPYCNVAIIATETSAGPVRTTPRTRQP